MMRRRAVAIVETERAIKGRIAMATEQKPGQSDQPGHTGQPAGQKSGQKADPSQAGNKPGSQSGQHQKKPMDKPAR
jgi:hypothetical protein